MKNEYSLYKLYSVGGDFCEENIAEVGYIIEHELVHFSIEPEAMHYFCVISVSLQ